MHPISAQSAESTGDILELPAIRFGGKHLVSALHPEIKRSGKSENGFLLIRPEEIRIVDAKGAKTRAATQAKVTQIHYYGHDAVLELTVPGLSGELKVRVTGALKYEVGKSVFLEHAGPIRWVSKIPTGE
jgi:iron(III) transport system ATP-binding protein